MSAGLISRCAGRVIVGALAAALSVGTLASCGSDGSVQAKVVRVIDGDTFEAEFEGATKSVRLLNVDTPETKHPNKIVECQGPEATQFLQKKLPVGSAVTLRFDQEKTDRDDRVLAAVFVKEELVNASIARTGLGIAKQSGSNAKYFYQVKAAQDEALAAKRGLFQENLSCSPEAVAAAELSALAAPAEPAAGASSAQIGATAGLVFTAVIAAKTAQVLLGESKDSVLALARGVQTVTAAVDRIGSAVAVATARHDDLKIRAAAAQVEEERKASEVKAAEAKAAEDKRTADEAAAKAASEAAAAAGAAAQQPYIPYVPAPQPQPVAPQQPAPAPVQQSPYPGYTGPRCYAPGGKTWTPCKR
ncbi:thermonuclease family protein [Psychromicrobium xiongbiense]|uniref:thermonuclease family protein n=1 Tax=Psychromicrobium xiongbiense TaxID=3051184 RepID=UPI002553F2B9|nr:thermonuclease family protein [Psychromicrobium sp. YIM S02556]